MVKKVDFGVYLAAGEGEEYSEILLPKKDVPAGLNNGDFIDVFIYKDSENRPIATTRKPFIRLNDFASLEVKDINKYGAFLDWGIENQLLLPFREQPESLSAGEKVAVMLYFDRVSGRLAATSRIEKFLKKTILPEDKTPPAAGDSVGLLIYDKTEIGYKAVIFSPKTETRYSGIIYSNDVFQHIKPGDTVKGYIKTVRSDGKIDLTLRKTGIRELESAGRKILNALEKAGGFLAVSDDSPPEVIKKSLEMSRKSFKKAAGMLYRDRMIQLEKGGIRLTVPAQAAGFGKKERELYKKALAFAGLKHSGQKRKFTGEPYLVHPVRTALTVKNYGGTISGIVAALLHDTIEDTDTGKEEIEKEFGKKIAKLVMDMTNDERQKASMGKALYLAKKMSGMDGETLLVKLADRLDNAGNLKYGDQDWSRKYAEETSFILDNIRNENLNSVHREIIGKIREKIKDYLH